MSIKLNVEDRFFSAQSWFTEYADWKTLRCHMTSQLVAVDMHGLSTLLFIVFAIVSFL